MTTDLSSLLSTLTNLYPGSYAMTDGETVTLVHSDGHRVTRFISTLTACEKGELRELFDRESITCWGGQGRSAQEVVTAGKALGWAAVFSVLVLVVVLLVTLAGNLIR